MGVISDKKQKIIGGKMRLIKNLPVAVKITTSFVVFLILLLVVGGYAVFQLIQVNAAFINVTGEKVEDKHSCRMCNCFCIPGHFFL